MASIDPLEKSVVNEPGRLDFLIEDVDKLVSLPDIYYRLESAISDPTTSTDTLARLLQSAPDLCARLLRMANSAFYSFPAKIETIDRAVSTIGLRQIRELILVTSVVKAFSGIPLEMVNMTMFWEHSIAVGIMARVLGQQAKLPNAESFYIPGLLHDIGRLVMYLKLPKLMHDLLLQRQHQGKNLLQLEQHCLGYTHADIGGRLLEFWKLPQSIYQPIAEHHDSAQGNEFELVSYAIHIADCWVDANRLDSCGEQFDPVTCPEALPMLNIEADDLEQIGRMATDQTRDVLRQFASH